MGMVGISLRMPPFQRKRRRCLLYFFYGEDDDISWLRNGRWEVCLLIGGSCCSLAGMLSNVLTIENYVKQIVIYRV